MRTWSSMQNRKHGGSVQLNRKALGARRSRAFINGCGCLRLMQLASVECYQHLRSSASYSLSRYTPTCFTVTLVADNSLVDVLYLFRAVFESLPSACRYVSNDSSDESAR